MSDTRGPMSVGVGLPKTPSGVDESKVGTVMNPGPATHTFSKRTPAKFKGKIMDTIPPKTPMGTGGGAMEP